MRNRLWEIVTRQETPEVATQQKAELRSLLNWSQMPYHATFVAWLEAQAGAPIRTDANMGADVVRSNAFKEILSYLSAKERMARGVLDE